MTGRRYSMFSGGLGSWRASKVDRLFHPTAEFGLVFTDPLYEDADTYRFLIEAAAEVLGRSLPFTVTAEDFPDYRVPEDTPIEEYRGNPEWRAFLADLRARTIDALPELVWLVDGRDPWEVFRDESFLGNSQRDPCSKILKRHMADAWRIGHCRRVGELFGPPDVFLVGIGIDESHRYYGDSKNLGIRRANAADGWIYEAPLIALEEAVARLSGAQIRAELPAGALSLLVAPVEEFGLRAPRMYPKGYKHGNCGGMCCKAGHAHYRNRFAVDPERFRYDKIMERKLISYVGGGVAMMTDRRGGEKRPMTLEEFEQRILAEPGRDYEYLPGESSCGCVGAWA